MASKVGNNQGQRLKIHNKQFKAPQSSTNKQMKLQKINSRLNPTLLKPNSKIFKIDLKKLKTELKKEKKHRISLNKSNRLFFYLFNFFSFF